MIDLQILSVVVNTFDNLPNKDMITNIFIQKLLTTSIALIAIRKTTSKINNIMNYLVSIRIDSEIIFNILCSGTLDCVIDNEISKVEDATCINNIKSVYPNEFDCYLHKVFDISDNVNYSSDNTANDSSYSSSDKTQDNASIIYNFPTSYIENSANINNSANNSLYNSPNKIKDDPLISYKFPTSYFINSPYDESYASQHSVGWPIKRSSN